MLKGAERLIDKAKTKSGESELVDGAPEQSRLDPLTAAPSDNGFLETVKPFIR